MLNLGNSWQVYLFKRLDVINIGHTEFCLHISVNNLTYNEYRNFKKIYNRKLLIKTANICDRVLFMIRVGWVGSINFIHQLIQTFFLRGFPGEHIPLQISALLN